MQPHRPASAGVSRSAAGRSQKEASLNQRRMRRASQLGSSAANAGPTRAPLKQSTALTSTAPGRPPAATSSSAIATTDTTTAGEGDHLQEQLRATLQRQLEADAEHQCSVIAYRHRIRHLYNDNATMRTIIAAAERRLRQGGGKVDSALTATVTDAECERLQVRINLAARRLNLLQYEINKQDDTVEGGRPAGELSALRGTQGGTAGSAPLDARTRQIEQKLDRVLMQQTSVGVVLRGYDHHRQELAEEGRRYDGRLQRLEAEFAARHRDHAQLVTLYLNAQESYQQAASAREKYLVTLRRLRGAKEKALAAKTAEVNAALRDTQRREQLLVDLQQQVDEETQQLEYAQHVSSQLEQRRLMMRSVHDVLQGRPSLGGEDGVAASDGVLTAAEEEKLAAYDRAFRLTMQSARAERLEDLVAAFEDEHANHGQLNQRVEDERDALARLRAEVKKLRQRVEERANGGAVAKGSTMMLDETRMFVKEEEAELRRQVRANEESAAQLLELARRIDLITEKAAAYRSDVVIAVNGELSLLQQGEPSSSSAAAPSDWASDSATARETARRALVGQLTVLKMKLLALADEVAQGGSCGGVEESLDTHAKLLVRSTQVVVPENNVRVALAHHSNASGARDGGRSSRSRGRGGVATLSLLQRSSRTRLPTASASADASSSSVDAEEAKDGAAVEDDARSASSARSGTSAALSTSGSSADAPGPGPSSPGVAAASGSNGGGAWASRNRDPLSRVEVKQLSAAIQERARRRLERERTQQKHQAS